MTSAKHKCCCGEAPDGCPIDCEDCADAYILQLSNWVGQAGPPFNYVYTLDVALIMQRVDGCRWRTIYPDSQGAGGLGQCLSISVTQDGVQLQDTTPAPDDITVCSADMRCRSLGDDHRWKLGIGWGLWNAVTVDIPIGVDINGAPAAWSTIDDVVAHPCPPGGGNTGQAVWQDDPNAITVINSGTLLVVPS